MALNLNTSPYYDDFNDDARFHRVLFKPGVPVQARELTQLQTILQDQMEKGFGFVVQEGAVITGCAEKTQQVDWIKVNDTDASGATINNTDLAKYKDQEIRGLTSGLKAKIVEVETGTVGAAPNLKTLYLKYLNTAESGGSRLYHFITGETLQVITDNVPTQAAVDAGTNLSGNTFVVNTLETANSIENTYYGVTVKMTLEPGIIHARGSFIKTDTLSVIVDRHNQRNTKHVGFVVTESVQQAATDSTLLDPAQGSFNYNAPGADRLKYTVALQSLDATATKPDNFYTYAHFNDGVIQRIGLKDNPLAGLGDILANRTFDESGNYLVRGNTVSLREHLQENNNGGVYTAGTEGGSRAALVVQIDPGISYVGGFKRELRSSKRLPLLKPAQTITKESQPISTSYGNYVRIDNLTGVFDVDGGAKIDLYNNTGGAGGAGSKVGEAKVRQLVYTSGTIGSTSAEYRLYLYDITMQNGDFTDVKSFDYNNGETWGGVANAIQESSATVLKESKVNKLVYRLSEKNIKTLKAETGGTYDYTFQYQKEFDVTLDSTNGNATLTLSGNESFPYSGTLTDTQKQNFVAIAKVGFVQNLATIAAGQYIDLTSANSNASVTVNSTQSITIDTGGAVTGTGTIKVLVPVQVADANPIAKSLQEGRYVKIDTSSHPSGTTGEYTLGVSEVYKLESVRAHTSALTSDTDGIDVTADFRLVDGQEDNLYGLSKIVKKNTSTLDLSTYDNLLVKYTNFDNTVSGPSFACVDSYPVDDASSPASGTIRTEDIPTYNSQKYGEFNLRDSLDFRPHVANTAALTTTIASATTNPLNDREISRPGSGLTNPVPTQDFSSDIIYYIGKKIRVVLDFDGAYRIVEGAYSENPKLPAQPAQCMTMAEIELKPYPSLSPELGRIKQKSAYQNKIKNVSQRRYTMENIGGLEKRIKNLEYYSSLNLLENFAKDQTIVNSGGTDRFKNGILVDPFTGHNVGAVLDPNYRISIDPTLKHARPFFQLENIDTGIFENITNTAAATGTELRVTGDLITMPYNRRVMQEQLQASQTENLTKELLFRYFGDMTLTPDVDNFIDTSVQPAVNINFDGNYDAWENMAEAWGTQWGSWEDTGAANVTTSTDSVDFFTTGGGGGGASFTTTTTEQSQVRQGIGLNVSAITETHNLGEKIIDVAFAPFMRTRAIAVSATRLKPDTRLYAFFDGENVTSNTTMADGTTTTLRTDTNGKIDCIFTLPAGRFKTGARTFKLTDSDVNGDKNSTTSAQAIYESSGMIQQKQDSIISMKTANVASQNYQDERTVTSVETDISIGGGNPLPPPPPPQIINNPIQVPIPVEVPVEVPVPVVPDPVPSPEPTTIITPEPTNPPAPVTPAPTIAVPAPTPDPGPPPTPAPTAAPTSAPAPVTPAPTAPPVIVDIGDWQFDWDFSGIDIWGGTDFFGGGNWGFDPLAQTFTTPNTPGGLFITDIELYFKNKPSSGDNGVTMQIREVINGVPGPRIVPGGTKRVERADIATSSEASGVTQFLPTVFQFDDPVYLQADTEYCFVPKPENDETGYDIWISELGENQVGTTERITKQPHGGIMFSSANNRTWTPHQSKDMMFKIHRAGFKRGTLSGKVANKNLDWINFSEYSTGSTIAWQAGTTLVGFTPTITSGGSGYSSAPTVTVNNSGTNGTGLAITAVISGGAVTGLTITSPGSGYTSAPTITIGAGTTTATATLTLQSGVVVAYDSLNEQVTVERPSTETIPFTASQRIGNTQGSALISSFTNKVVNEVALNAGLIVPHEGTRAEARVAINTTGQSDAVGKSGFSETYTILDFNTTTALDTERTIYSRSNELATYSGDKTSLLEITLKTDRDNVSPVLSLSQLDLLCIVNKVNNDSTDENTRFKGNAESRYITRRVVLEDGQDAEDLNVYLDASIPSEGDIKVYGKFQNAADECDFNEDIAWVELSSKTPPFEQTEEFAEYEFGLPAKAGAGTSGLNASNSNIFEYDVKALLSVGVTAGGSGYSATPTVTITGGGGYGASAKATVSGGAITAFEITNPGREYTSTPTITVTDGSGSGVSVGTVTVGNITYQGYKTFAIKVVPLSTTTSKVPKFKDLRAIALQV